MRKVNISDIPEKERRSPSRKFHAYFKEISVALGRDPQSAERLKQHPFDLAFYRLPPRASRCPFHVHSAEWELYVILSGRAAVRDQHGLTEATAGDSFIFAPGEAHEIRNAGDEDLTYYCIANNTVGECCYYPDSDKWWVDDGSGTKIVKGNAVDYFVGEDEV